MKRRLTITVDEDVIASYQTIAGLTKQTLSKTVSDWLVETLPALVHMSHMIQVAKSSPARAMADLDVFQEQLSGELSELQGGLAALARVQPRARPQLREDVHPDAPTSPSPQFSPHSNTGLKPPQG